ncbi:MAG: hypothetical protein N3I35_11665 [Clostridia bacterium]|nr:hypothetical protein [Clostridia bacterium]
MMKRLIIILISLFCLCTIVVLVFNKNNVANSFSEKGLVVYLLKKDSTEKTVLFTENDIREFDWGQQKIIFDKKFLNEKVIGKGKANKDEKYSSGGSKILSAKYQERFLLSLQGEEIYKGAFKQPFFSSYYPDIPYIEDIENGIRINWNKIEGREDVRFNKKLYDYLKQKKIISLN